MNNPKLQAILQQALALEQQQQYPESLKLFEQLDSFSPNNQRVLLKLVRLNRLLNKLTAAEHYMLKVQGLPNQDPKLVPLMLQEAGQLFMARHQFAQAVDCFKELTKVVTDYAPGYFLLADAQQEANQHQQAVESFEKCLALNPDNKLDIKTKIASSLAQLGKVTEAKQMYQQVLEQEPTHYPAWFGLAMVEFTLGDFNASSEAYRRCINVNPNFMPAYQQLTDTKKYQDIEDSDIKLLSEALTNEQLDDFGKERLHFGLGKAFNDCQAYEQAYKHFEQANQLKYQRLPKFNQEQWRDYISKIIETFTPSFLNDHKLNNQSDNLEPMLIVGMPRSGSTLIEQIVSAHPQVTGAGELTYLATAAEQSFSRFPNAQKLADTSLLQQTQSGYLAHLSEQLDKLAVEQSQDQTNIVIDKYPSNYLYLGLSHLLFPNSKFIYSARSPLDICLSIYFHDFAYGNRYGNNWDDLIFYYQQHQRLIDHWKQVIPNAIYQVTYEDLLENQELETQKLIEFCGLDWQEQLLKPEQNTRNVSTFSAWQVRQPIYKTSKKRWKNYQPFIEKLLEAFPEYTKD